MSTPPALFAGQRWRHLITTCALFLTHMATPDAHNAKAAAAKTPTPLHATTATTSTAQKIPPTLAAPAPRASGYDPRLSANGIIIPTKSYSDQPYLIDTDDGAWLCVVTTGAGHEGEAGQHIIALRSQDCGCTWSAPVPIEPANGPEASWGVLLKTPAGRVYCFYVHNTDNQREIAADNPPYRNGKAHRMDSHGHYVFRYSDDHGCTWSQQRYEIPVRAFAIDRENAYHGDVRLFWNVGRAFTHDGAAYLPLHKVGGFGRGWFTRSEGALLCSDNLLTEREPARIRWQTLPDGDIGLRAPEDGGPIAEEQNFAVLSEGSYFCVYRTIAGHPACTYSRDQGKTWEAPLWLTYADGRLMKHPRAANFVWKLANGKYLYWYHNHGGRFIAEDPNRAATSYNHRNPAWMSGGVEIDTPRGREIAWSQPEIVLYDDTPATRMSYPDLIEKDGHIYFTETNKTLARVHELPRALAEGAWATLTPATLAAAAPTDKLLLDENAAALTGTRPLCGLPAFIAENGFGPDLRAGITIELCVKATTWRPGDILLDTRDHTGTGFAVKVTSRSTVEIVLNDGRSESRWDCDPDTLETNCLQHIAIIVDGGPKIISYVIDGKFCDGGDARQFGWGRFNPLYRGPARLPTKGIWRDNGTFAFQSQEYQADATVQYAPHFDGKLTRVRIWGRALRTAEAVALASETH